MSTTPFWMIHFPFLLLSSGFKLHLQETQSIHDSINIKKSNSFLKYIQLTTVIDSFLAPKVIYMVLL